MNRLAVMLWLGLPLILTACATSTPRIVVPAPNYGIGDSYSFDDGTVRTVVAIEGDRIIWRDTPRQAMVTTRDIMLPPLSVTAPGRNVHQRVVGSGLFPLRSGKQTVFIVTPDAAPQQGAGESAETGSCIVGQHSPTTTPAGTFDTVRVACTLHRPGSREVLRRTYYYAPSIAYYVRREERIGEGPVRSIQLVHHTSGNPMLTNAALLRRTEAIQAALEHKVSDTAVQWRDPASDAAGSIEPVRTERSPNLGWCREFRERLRVGARDYDLLGTACRTGGGTWLVKQITPFRAAS